MSLLGPLLLLIYANDITKAFKNPCLVPSNDIHLMGTMSSGDIQRNLNEVYRQPIRDLPLSLSRDKRPTEGKAHQRGHKHTTEYQARWNGRNKQAATGY